MTIPLYEGSLRNRRHLCAELGIKPGPDRYDTDLRVIEAGFRRWGQELPCHLYGSFVFAIRDETDGKLFCARDPFGIRTLYYHDAGNGIFLYGPDLRAIAEDPRYRKSLDREALHLYVLFGYPVGEKTLYRGIRKLMPGCRLIRDGESFRIDRWYSPSFHPDMSLSEEEWAGRIDRVLQDILDEDRYDFDFRQCRSFLSGGVDSSYLLASSGVSEAIGIGFGEAGFSETPDACAAADGIGARFREIRISAEQYFEAIPRFLRSLELPLADPAAPAFALGCEQAAGEAGPCLSGEGADEFFAGYYVYRRADELGREGALYFGCDGVMDQEGGMRLLGTGEAYPLEELTAEVRRQTQGADPLSRMLAVDIALWLEGDILFNAGRSARTNGIDLLLPFADRRMFELSAAIPSALKRKDGIAKYILRKAAETRLPHETAFRRKVGFSVPARQWFREERFRPRIEQAIFGPVSEEYFNRDFL